MSGYLHEMLSRPVMNIKDHKKQQEFKCSICLTNENNDIEMS